jgi:hypothetical protein
LFKVREAKGEWMIKELIIERGNAAEGIVALFDLDP